MKFQFSTEKQQKAWQMYHLVLEEIYSITTRAELPSVCILEVANLYQEF